MVSPALTPRGFCCAEGGSGMMGHRHVLLSPAEIFDLGPSPTQDACGARLRTI